MTTLGVTGHSQLSERGAELVYRDLVEHVAGYPAEELVGITCLARGADQLFADAILDRGGRLEIIAPSIDYFDHISDEQQRARCTAFRQRAASVHTLPHAHAGSAAYLAASELLVDRCDRLIAVWDGGDSSGTADAVAYARSLGREITIVWPEGAERVSF
ncbi:hypothetical protein E0H73_24005 [Kribbella pittospori]|uniref:DUF1273 family protein n=1 Tax=Kribbella pittospori TaxID=722689 RepID=A0A4R0KIZ9_9ACTN|nr:hypothetical protein [Kribbella pittospori]TCC59687.1 hypothetical protein E0H73_24005 [Kribbella pittospori]